MLEGNTVFRSVEGTAHGYFSLLRYEVGIIAALGLAGVLVHPLLGVLLVLFGYAGLTAARRWDHGRREYLKLWARRFDKQQYRLLDPDTEYVPYGRGE